MSRLIGVWRRDQGRRDEMLGRRLEAVDADAEVHGSIVEACIDICTFKLAFCGIQLDSRPIPTARELCPARLRSLDRVIRFDLSWGRLAGQERRLRLEILEILGLLLSRCCGIRGGTCAIVRERLSGRASAS